MATGQSGARALTVARGARSGGGTGAQARAIRRDGWTPKRCRIFFETLAATCNVTHAARTAGKCVASAYNQKRRDPGFAREWDHALSVGYAELEALLLRQSLFGTEQEEISMDGQGAVKGRKVRKAMPLGVGLRLLLAHRGRVEALRVQEMRDRPNADDAVARMRDALDTIRAKRAGDGPCVAALQTRNNR